ncbi:hypothetical protein LTR49_028730, partial [Elasticomyces elasticus]
LAVSSLTEMRLPPHDAKERAKEQSDRRSAAVGSSLPVDTIQDILRIAQTLDPRPLFVKYAETRFLWEILDMGEDTDILKMVKTLVFNWVQVSGSTQSYSSGQSLTINETKDNITRVVESVGRQPYEPDNLVSGFAIFRMKQRNDGPDWITLNDHGWPEPNDPHDLMPQTAVFVALSDLCYENGFFMDLKSGQDVCLDTKEDIVYPPKGGGLGVAFWLRL